jgi:hypothetical protein
VITACTLGFRACAISFCARARVHAATRPSLRPLFFQRGETKSKARAKFAARTKRRVESHFVAILRDAAFAAPQDEVFMCGALSDPHGEEARKRRLRTMLRIAGRTMKAPKLIPSQPFRSPAAIASHEGGGRCLSDGEIGLSCKGLSRNLKSMVAAVQQPMYKAAPEELRLSRGFCLRSSCDVRALVP